MTRRVISANERKESVIEDWNCLYMRTENSPSRFSVQYVIKYIGLKEIREEETREGDGEMEYEVTGGGSGGMVGGRLIAAMSLRSLDLEEH
ncbi:hypothetical protein O3M35_009056 [Rhynocoris fuscipes]|uniref:Uncharacterized protein n=1 Tax=Rhynocoris fuscipes TaxID=488301 RepID=A0AAW1D962_9HEMI